jgi:hypothetical protein
MTATETFEATGVVSECGETGDRSASAPAAMRIKGTVRPRAARAARRGSFSCSPAMRYSARSIVTLKSSLWRSSASSSPMRTMPLKNGASLS